MELIADPLGRETGGHAHGGVERTGTHGWRGGEGEAARADEGVGRARTRRGEDGMGTHGRRGGEDGHARVAGWMSRARTGG